VSDTRPYSDAVTRGANAKLGMLVSTEKDAFERLWKKRSVWSDIPVQIVWALKDPILNRRDLSQLKTGLPHAGVHTLPQAGHFLQETSPHEITEQIRFALVSLPSRDRRC
jgi:pimeloyl-ACP methyl ester carboxylesterase